MPEDRNSLVGEIRRFNRFYTGLIGLLDETLYGSPHALAEARVLFELGRSARRVATSLGGTAGFLARALHLDAEPVASEVARELQLDPAYVTSILRKFSAAGLTEMRADPDDRRRLILSLSLKGKAALARLEATADRDLLRLTTGLDDKEAAELSDMLTRVTHLLGRSARRV